MKATDLIITEFETVPGTNIRGVVQHFGDRLVTLVSIFTMGVTSVFVHDQLRAQERGLTVAEYERLQENAFEAWKAIKEKAITKNNEL